MFNKYWFSKNQTILLWFANTWLGKQILHIDSKEKLIAILPNAIFWKKGKEYVAEFRSHNKFSKRLYYAFYPLWRLFHLWDMFWYPKFNLGFDTLGPVYPDADPETTTMDGNSQNSDASFATCRSAAAGNSTSASNASSNCQIAVDIGIYYVARNFHLFDTSALTASVTISAATYSVYDTGAGFANSDSDSLHAVSSNPASNTALVDADFDQVGSTSFGSISLASWTGSAYNGISLNASGLANISKTGVSKFGQRIGGDLNNSAPSSADRVQTYMADQTGTANDPKLEVTYSIPSGGFFALV